MTAIFEELFILALDEEEGEIPKSVEEKMEPILAGAVLAELLLHHRIELRDDRIVVQDQTPTENPILDISLFEILESSKPRKLRYWINTLVHSKIIEEIGHDLVRQEILVRKKKHLWMASPQGNGTNGKVSLQSNLKNKIDRIVTDGYDTELPDKALLAILYYGDLLKLVYKHRDRKEARKRIKTIVQPEDGAAVLGGSLDEIIATACEIIV